MDLVPVEIAGSAGYVAHEAVNQTDITDNDRYPIPPVKPVILPILLLDQTGTTVALIALR
jgi:hypothetical protein